MLVFQKNAKRSASFAVQSAVEKRTKGGLLRSSVWVTFMFGLRIRVRVRA
jgi:hypothetical protein